ncbi:hypothetical protein [Burkholderia oklahomensis]|uniref:hypothetical protein n=1 Tax=Burkholderia oklahomensis TaxID=342113 RepID=UPI0012FE019B|nr:hypothetical protein [Burkholderia oklahomensis]
MSIRQRRAIRASRAGPSWTARRARFAPVDSIRDFYFGISRASSTDSRSDLSTPLQRRSMTDAPTTHAAIRRMRALRWRRGRERMTGPVSRDAA